MLRVLTALALLMLFGCQDPAIQARIQIDPDVRADCIALDVLSPAGEPLQTKIVPRATDRDEVRLAVYRGGLPEEIQLQARALWGPSCVYNGHSEVLSAHFESKTIGSVLLQLSRPPSSEDADGDGFVTDRLGGPDCADSMAESHPQALETCDTPVDLDCDGHRGCEDATCSARGGCAQAPSALVLQGPTEAGHAGDCVLLTVMRLDEDGQPATPGYPTEISAIPSDSPDFVLYEDAACGQALTALTIPSWMSSTRFFARSMHPADVSVTATSAGFAPVSVAYSLLPRRATQLVFTSGALDVQAGACAPLVLERRDDSGTPSVGEAPLLTLTPAPTSQTALYGDPDCKVGLSTVTFPQDQSTLTLYFRSERAGSIPVTVSGIGAVGPQQTENVKAGDPERLNVLLPGKDLLAGECSALSKLESVDHYGNRSIGTDLVATLTAPAAMNAGFFSDSTCKTPITTTTFHADATADFYFRAKTGGPGSIGASMAGRTAIPPSQTIINAVRSGSCVLPAAASTVNCTTSLGLRDRTKSFLVFQATTVEAAVHTAYVRCSLKDTNTITCARFDATGAKDANIQWQVVEMAQGLSVQHLEKPFVSGTTSITFTITPVDRTKSFLLYSTSQNGDFVSSNDHVAVRFTSDSQVQVDCQGAVGQETVSLQVVTLDGISMSRNVTGTGSTSPLEDNSPFTTDEASRSVLLTTFQSASDTGDKICNRMVRGEIGPSANKVRFSWGLGVSACNAPGIPKVAWERILWPAGTLVQARTVDMSGGQSQTTASLGAVDVTRTLLLSSAQASGGQGNGETDDTTSDTAGAAMARLTFDSNTQLHATRDLAEGNARWTVYAIQLEF